MISNDHPQHSGAMHAHSEELNGKNSLNSLVQADSEKVFTCILNARIFSPQNRRFTEKVISEKKALPTPCYNRTFDPIPYKEACALISQRYPGIPIYSSNSEEVSFLSLSTVLEDELFVDGTFLIAPSNRVPSKVRNGTLFPEDKGYLFFKTCGHVEFWLFDFILCPRTSQIYLFLGENNKMIELNVFAKDKTPANIQLVDLKVKEYYKELMEMSDDDLYGN